MKKMNQIHEFVNKSKKLALMLALFLLAVTSFSYAAGPGEIAREVKASFKQDFKNAEILSTEVNKSYTKLTFRMDNIILFAFYGDNGHLLAVVRNILSSQLPINLQMDLKKKYSDYWITELFELNGDGQNYYYISLENADKTVILRSSDNESWEIFEEKAKK